MPPLGYFLPTRRALVRRRLRDCTARRIAPFGGNYTKVPAGNCERGDECPTDLCWLRLPPDLTELVVLSVTVDRKTWACRRYCTAWVDSENALTRWQVRFVELLEVDFSVERSRFGVL